MSEACEKARGELLAHVREEWPTAEARDMNNGDCETFAAAVMDVRGVPADAIMLYDRRADRCYLRC